jgi:hypothetical protein
MANYNSKNKQTVREANLNFLFDYKIKTLADKKIKGKWVELYGSGHNVEYLINTKKIDPKNIIAVDIDEHAIEDCKRRFPYVDTYYGKLADLLIETNDDISCINYDSLNSTGEILKGELNEVFSEITELRKKFGNIYLIINISLSRLIRFEGATEETALETYITFIKNIASNHDISLDIHRDSVDVYVDNKAKMGNMRLLL